MNTPQILRFPMGRSMIVVLILLVAALLAVFIPLSLFTAYRSPAPIQADSLKMVESFLNLLIS